MSSELPAQIILDERTPSVEEYLGLREAAGLGKADPETVTSALMNSLFSVCAIYEGKAVGCGRVVGDGGLYFFIQDVFVMPEFKEHGIDELIMISIMDFLREMTTPDAYIGMLSAGEDKGLFERFGFHKLPESGHRLLREEEEEQ